MIVGVPKEVKDDEYRVAITPAGVHELTSAGHAVFVEKGAGVGSSIPDEDFVATGATDVADPDDVWAAVRPDPRGEGADRRGVPRLGLRKDQVLFTYLHLAASRPCTEALLARATPPSPTRRSPARQLAAPAHADERGGRPHGAAHGVPPPDAPRRRPGGADVRGARRPLAKVVILGAGVAGMAAATWPSGMHSEVYILDRNLERLRQVDRHFRGRLETVASNTHAVEEACVDADIVIGAVLVVGAKAPNWSPTTWWRGCGTVSVLVDISVDQGGCFESTRPTTHSDPTFEVNGSIFYCVANMPGAVPHSSTHALINATLPYVLEIANHGWRDAVRPRPGPGRGGQRGGGDGRLRAGGRGPRHRPPPAGHVRQLSGRLRPPEAPGPTCASPRRPVAPGPVAPREVGGQLDASRRSGSATGSRRTVRSGTSPAHTSRAPSVRRRRRAGPR